MIIRKYILDKDKVMGNIYIIEKKIKKKKRKKKKGKFKNTFYKNNKR